MDTYLPKVMKKSHCLKITKKCLICIFTHNFEERSRPEGPRVKGAKCLGMWQCGVGAYGVWVCMGCGCFCDVGLGVGVYVYVGVGVDCGSVCR